MVKARVSAAVFACALATAVLAAQQGGTRQAQPQTPGGQPNARDPQPATDQGPSDQTQTNPQGQPVFRGNINFVRVDVIVSDKKQQPVSDLKMTDFDVLEDGKPQKIEQFSAIKVDGNIKPGEPPPQEIRNRDDEVRAAEDPEARVYAILLDDYHVRRANSISIRATLTKFLETQVRPKDLLAVMYPLSPVTDVSFTHNVNSIISAVNNFEGRKFDYRPRNQLEENYSRVPTETVEKIRNDVVIGALRGLSVRLGSLREGRKSIIFVSEGFTATLPAQMRRADASRPQDPVAVSDGPVPSSQEITYEWFEQSELDRRMRDVYEAANRNNASIYSLDPRGLAVFEYDIDDGGINPPPGIATDARALRATQDTLRQLSDETDGRAIVNRNTLAEGLAQISRDSSFYYLLGYTSAQAATDGKFHEIKVRVKRPGVDVRARKGYWAYTREDVERASKPFPEVAKPVQQALASIAPVTKTAGKYIQTWVGTERGSNGKTRVTLVWEPLPATPGLHREQPGRVSVLAADQKGDLVFRGRSPDAALAAAGPSPGPNDTGATGRTLSAAPPASTAQKLVFDAPPGKLELRLTVEGTAGVGTLDQDTRRIDVPDLTGPQAVITTPRVFHARTARDFQAMSANTSAVPAASREFSRTERLLIRFDVYAPGSEQPTVTATLLNRAGQKITDLPVTPAPSGGTHQIDFSLSSIPASEYLIEIVSKGPSGEVKELVPLRVTS
jgi:VWFA-related protein